MAPVVKMTARRPIPKQPALHLWHVGDPDIPYSKAFPIVFASAVTNGGGLAGSGHARVLHNSMRSLAGWTCDLQ